MCPFLNAPSVFSNVYVQLYYERGGGGEGGGGMLHFDSTMTNILSLIFYCASSLRQQSSLLHSDA